MAQGAEDWQGKMALLCSAQYQQFFAYRLILGIRVFSVSCQYIPGLCMHAENFASYLLCLHQGNPELLSWLYSQSIPNLPQHPRVDNHQHWNLSFPPQLEQLRCRLHLQQGKSAVIAVRI